MAEPIKTGEMVGCLPGCGDGCGVISLGLLSAAYLAVSLTKAVKRVRR